MTQALDSLKVLVLDGDGIGPEVNAQALRVLSAVCSGAGITLSTESAPFGGASIDDNGAPVTESTLALAAASDAVLLGAVGGPKWDGIATHMRPEKGLLSLRSSLGAFANLRPAKMFAALEDACPLKPEVRGNVDLMVVRELIGGIYFGSPRGIETREGQRVGFNTLVYSESEIVRIGRVAFETARLRDKRLTSVDKSNVLEVMVLWREVMTELGKEYPDVALSHMYVDNAAMQIIAHPSQFDVLVTGNMFGDILSDAAAALTGSLGMLPSAAMGPGGSVYEPVHGSAPDIAGQGKANPLAAILSAAMLLEHTAKRADLARQVENAVGAALDAGLRTSDIGRGATDIVSTAGMGDAVLDRL